MIPQVRQGFLKQSYKKTEWTATNLHNVHLKIMAAATITSDFLKNIYDFFYFLKTCRICQAFILQNSLDFPQRLITSHRISNNSSTEKDNSGKCISIFCFDKISTNISVYKSIFFTTLSMWTNSSPIIP